MVPNGLFRQVNGYSNEYWGWGRQDVDLRQRFLSAGIELGRRKGTFKPLYHDNRGWAAVGVPSSESERNRKVYKEKWAAGRTGDGLSTIDFDILRRGKLPDPSPERDAVWGIVTVQLAMEAAPEAVPSAGVRSE